jgi:hypothetical protein
MSRFIYCYAKCRNAECRGALNATKRSLKSLLSLLYYMSMGLLSPRLVPVSSFGLTSLLETSQAISVEEAS